MCLACAAFCCFAVAAESLLTIRAVKHDVSGFSASYLHSQIALPSPPNRAAQISQTSPNRHLGPQLYKSNFLAGLLMLLLIMVGRDG